MTASASNQESVNEAPAQLLRRKSTFSQLQHHMRKNTHQMHWRTFTATPYLEFCLGGPRSVWPNPSFLPERPLQRDVGSAIGDDDNHDTTHVPAGLRVDPDTNGLKGKEEMLRICERDEFKEESFNSLECTCFADPPFGTRLT
jgi:hypothetical protein